MWLIHLVSTFSLFSLEQCFKWRSICHEFSMEWKTIILWIKMFNLSHPNREIFSFEQWFTCSPYFAQQLNCWSKCFISAFCCIPNSQQTRSRTDLISECISDLCRGKWEFALVKVEQSLEIDEDTLSGLWSKETVNTATMINIWRERKDADFSFSVNQASNSQYNVIFSWITSYW